MNAITTMPEQLDGTLNIELLSDEELLSIGAGGPWMTGALLLAGGGAAAAAGVVVGVGVYLVCRQLSN